MSKEEKRADEMAEYLIHALEGGGQKGFRLKKSTQEERIQKYPENYGPHIDARVLESNIYMLTDTNDIILLVPDKITNSEYTTPSFRFNKAYSFAKRLTRGHAVASVVYKDNTTFFRSPFNEKLPIKQMRDYHWLSKEDRKHRKNIIHLSPEEIALVTNNQENAITYYQPTSPRLEQMIRSFQFQKSEFNPAKRTWENKVTQVHFDYSKNLWLQEEVGITEADSKRLYRWTREKEKKGALYLRNNIIFPVAEQHSTQ